MVWDGWDLIEERDAAGNEVRRYVQGAGVDEILAMIDTAGAHYHHHDALGNVIALSSGTGALEETYRYDAFGKATVTNAATSATGGASFFGNRFLFTGREWIAEAGLYDYRNRVYSAALGRFMQTDPIMFEAGDVNVYRYVGNGPLNAVDSLGLDDYFIGGSGSVIIVSGLTVGAGFVWDSDTWMDSGIYLSGGTGLGVDVSASITGGKTTADVEGGGGALNFGYGPLGMSILTPTERIGDYLKSHPWDAEPRSIRGEGPAVIASPKKVTPKALRLGLPASCTYTDTQTGTLSPNAVINAAKGIWNSMKSAWNSLF